MIKKVFRIILIVFGILAFLFFLAVLSLKLFLPDEKLKDIFVTQLRGYLMCEAEIERVSYSLFSGLEIHDYKISNSPSFKAGVLAAGKKIVLKTGYLPLLQGKFKITRILLDSPVVNISQRDIKNFNIDRFKRKSPPKYVPMVLLISELDVNNAKINFLGQNDITLDALSLSAKNISLGEIFDLKAWFDIKNEKRSVTFDSVLKIDPAKKRIIFDSLTGSTEKEKLTINGFIEGFKEPTFDINIKGDKAIIKDVAAIFSISVPFDLFERDLDFSVSGSGGKFWFRK